MNRKNESDMQKIYVFAMVWMQMYKNHATIPFSYFEDIQFVGDGLKELGFEMDCHESLKALGIATNFESLDDWQRTVNTITDIQALGNGIYSQWRYWNHWAMAPMEEGDFQWFVISFKRLAELASE